MCINFLTLRGPYMLQKLREACQPTDNRLGLDSELSYEARSRLAARQSDPLSCPERQILLPSLLGRGIPEHRCQRILEREWENGLGGVSAVDFHHQAVDDSPSR